MPFGTLIGNKYQQIINKRRIKSSNKQQIEMSLKVIINELISNAKHSEFIFGTISVDNAIICNSNDFTNSVLLMKLQSSHLLELILPQSCITLNDSDLEVKLSQVLDPLCSVHYKCKSEGRTDRFLTYEYNIQRSKSQANHLHIDLAINIKSAAQLKFNTFSVHFKSSNKLTPIRPNSTFGQLRNESVGLVWIIGNKFPKTGEVRLNFEIISQNKRLEIDTNCNFKVDNFHTTQRSNHLNITEIKLIAENKIPIVLESSLTSVDYKFYPNYI